MRREPCPKCGQGIVSVTHRIRLNGWGGVESDTPASVAGCRTEICEWFDTRTGDRVGHGTFGPADQR